MSNKVFANGREISCKAAAGKTICAMPDVCFTPPENPATPPGVPIPYPNTGMASDTTDGSKNVKISNKEVGLKNKSCFKKSTGDEAGSAAKKGVITSKNTGKVFFESWSVDVKIEGQNAVRHLDLTTNNHASTPGDTPPWPYVDSAALGSGEDPCEDEKAKEQEDCGGMSDDEACDDDDCRAARRCKLVPYGGTSSPNCCDDQQGHHMIEGHWVKDNSNFPMAQPPGGHNAAPTVCVEGGRFQLTHGEMHMAQGMREESFMAGGANFGDPWDYGAGKSSAIMAHDMTFGDEANCSRGCLEAQLDDFYGDDDTRKLKSPSTQSLAQKDPNGDGRWRRPDAERVLDGQLGRI